MIPGLIYLEDWLSEKDSQTVIKHIEKGVWQTSLKRRVQQYGPVYDYSTKKLAPELFSVPEWLDKLAQRLHQVELFEAQPNQVIINEYMPGQGIARHIDSPRFGPTIASLSLCSCTTMMLGQYNGKELQTELKKNSLLVLTGEARNSWYHCIPKVAERRVSITFRTAPQTEQPTVEGTQTAQQ